MSQLDTLPNELVTAIVEHVHPGSLHACTLINRQFHDLANPFLWHSISINTSAHFNKLMAGMTSALVAEPTNTTLTPLGQLIRHVHLGHFITNVQFLRFMELASNVEDLIMKDAVKITDRSAKHIGRHCPDLKYLNLSHSQVTRSSIFALGEHCRQLSHLILLSCPGVTFDVFQALASCPLKNIVIHVCGNEDETNDEQRGVGRYTVNQGVKYLVRYQHVTSLALLHCPYDFSERLIATLVSTKPLFWPHLKKLSLNGCESLTDLQAIAFIRSRPKLTVLAFEPNMLSDLFLDAVAVSLPVIESLGISGSKQITPEAVRKMVRRCFMLEQVRLNGCGMTIFDFPEVNHYCLDLEDLGGKTVALLDMDTIMCIQMVDTSDDEDDSGDDDNYGD